MQCLPIFFTTFISRNINIINSFKDDPCFRKCTRELIPPFCGSNGKTYNNECVFEVDKCRKLGPELRITSKGRCLDKVETKNNENESVVDAGKFKYFFL